MSMHPPPHGETHPAGHEPDRVNARSVGVIGLVLVAVVIGSLYGLSLLYARLQPKRESAPSAWRVEERPPIDFDQPAQLRALRNWEEEELHSYRWSNPEKTAARVPIERAMEMLVETGDPFASAVEDPTKIEPADESPKEPTTIERENGDGKKDE
jgi:hypothetical protein